MTIASRLTAGERMAWRLVKALAVVATAAAVTGCATTATNKDPIEGFNRSVFAFNEGLDKALIKPAAKGYEAIVPSFVRTGVTNFFGNVSDVFVAVNNLLQGKPAEAVNDAARVLFNSTFGMLGFFDVATEMGLDKHEEDFGQTLGRWGAGPGAYVVVPVFGPRNARDTLGLVLDIATDPVANLDDIALRNSLSVLRLISERAAVLPADKIIEEAAIDKYSYIRDAYLQRRLSQVYDGRPPREPEDE